MFREKGISVSTLYREPRTPIKQSGHSSQRVLQEIRLSADLLQDETIRLRGSSVLGRYGVIGAGAHSAGPSQAKKLWPQLSNESNTK
jgi:hypothetical protein